MSRPRVDWEALRAPYEAGEMSLAELGRRFGCSASTISRHAQRQGWARVTGLVTVTVTVPVPTESAPAPASEVLEQHQRLLTRTRSILEGLLGELHASTHNVTVFERLGDLMGADVQETGRARDRVQEAYRAVISLPGRTKSAKELTDVLGKLMNLERMVYGLDDNERSGRGRHEADELLHLINGVGAEPVEDTVAETGEGTGDDESE